MISEDQARAKILETIRRLSTRQIPLSDALDCFAAEDCFARLPLPNFDNSAMDGYAVVASSCARGKRLHVVGEQPAGLDRQLRVCAGEAVRIFTGAPMPGGADAVVMQEDVTREGNEILLNIDVDLGEFVRRRGCDLGEGQKILAAGERIRAATLGLLASQGFGEIRVGAEVDAAIISTGDELVKFGEQLRPGQIYESNSILLQALLQKCCAIVKSVQSCRDDDNSLGPALRSAIKNRVLIINGGVSVGEHDLVQAALRSLGAEIDIWRVAIKPGKPFLFGRIGECAVFGLPGNPVSAFVTFLRFVRPAILKMMGACESELEPAKVPAKLTVDLGNDGDRARYFRGRFWAGKFSPIGRQESHALFGLSQSNALLRLAAGEELKNGTAVELLLFD
ncbi:MAG TPA: gephyrin-like molybdotransferase Glp [Chthoniobacterales bacterium]|nr:gephyrin-like molybdotransferase Glp [Chthoniobacterales bacterium]